MSPQLFSYVVDHDHGYAPDPEDELCTLVHCKFGGIHGRRNIVEIAEEGDWILGTGGAGYLSAGHGRIIYLMRVDKKIPFQDYISSPDYRHRFDCHDPGHGNKYALLSSHFFYFGRNAIDIARLPNNIDRIALLKHGIGYRRDMPAPQLQLLVRWFERTYRPGVHGLPCAPSNPAISGARRIRYKCAR